MSIGILIVVTHLLGAGHLTRAAALGRALARRGHPVTLVSGGMPARLVSGAGLDLVQLPPIRTSGVDFRALLDEAGRPAGPERLAERRRQLLDTLRETKPAIVVTELYPFGRRVLAEEFSALIAAARALAPRPLVACSIRDVLVAPARPDRIVATHDRLVADYDLVLVHGDPDLVPLDASWPVEDRIRPLLRDTGYVDDGEPVAPCAERRGIVVSGGSSAAALPLLDAALAAAKTVTREPWRALVGAGVPEAEFARLGAAAPGHVAVERARPDFRLLLAGAAVSVSQAGYNTVVDLFRAGPRPVLVPFEAGSETEQRLRAERLEAAGLATLLPERDLSPERLAAAVERALAAPQAAGPLPRLDGADRAATLLLDALARLRLAEKGAIRPPPASLRDSHFAAAAPGGQKGALPASRRLRGEARRTSDLPEARSSMRKPENAPPEARPLARPRSLVPGPSPKRERGAALDWHPLREAFARRRDAGAEPALWWRDDDAGADSPALRRLIALARESGCPVAVAAIPRRTDPSLKPLLRESGVAALVHGLAHENHAPPDAKKAEFGPHRPLGTLVAEAQSALSEARAALGETLLPVFVPPWNRMAPRLAARLPALGYVGLSAWGDGPETAGLLRADTHIDPVDWHGGRSLFAPKTLIARAAAALDRRANDPCAPLGLLTHHLVHDEAIWGFCAALFEEWRRLSGRFVLAKDLFCVGQPDRRGAVGR